MTATTEEDLHPCACGCGTLVKNRWAKGHWAKGEASKRGLTPLPGPDDDIPEDEELPAELEAELDALDWLESQPPLRGDSGDTGDTRDDPRPSRIPPLRTTPHAKQRRTATATMRRDVHAKIRMVLMPAGQFWQIRDAQCGGTFVKQEPEISDALAEIVCDSPDLLNWFTGPAGGYMKYFKLVMAVQPVLFTVWLHHIAHATPDVDGQQPQQMPQFAA